MRDGRFGTVGGVDHAEPDVELGVPLLQRVARHRYTPRELFVFDVIAMVLLLLLAVLGGPHKSPRLSTSAAHTFDLITDVLAALAVLCRRRFPRPTLAVLLPIALSILVLRADGPAPFYLALALYSVIAVSPRTTGLRVAAGVIVLCLIGTIVGGGDLEATSLTGLTALLLLAWVAAEYARASRRYARHQAEREAERAAAAEAMQADEIQRAIAGERVKIARDLHDIVAHAMSVIAVRSGVARMVIDSQPEQAREALSIIETTTRRTLQEMRLLVGMLRDDDERAAERGPVPGVEDLDRLVREVELAGVAVELAITGVPRSLPPAADLSAYRIIQEALTNVVRHAGPTRARVQLSYRPEGIGIDIRDEGPPPASDGGQAVAHHGAGHGIIGMRERAAMFGGTLQAQPCEAGFQVRASLRTDA